MRGLMAALAIVAAPSAVIIAGRIDNHSAIVAVGARATAELTTTNMPIQTPSAKILVADGQGGMRALEDHRFDERGWPISFAVSPKDATAWMAHLHAECESRGWQSGGLSQLEPEQNSGSLTIHAAEISTAAALEIAWEKSRDETLSVRARSGALSEDAAREFFSAIDARLKNRTTLTEHRRAYLTYNVLPWRGELWLDRDLRLGPPSQYPDTTFGPQIVVVDAMVEGIGWQGVNAQFQRTLFELRVFLSVVLGGRFEEMKWTRGWAYDLDERGQITDCRLATLGYAEIKETPRFPAAGSAPPINRRIIERPGIGERGVTIGITPDMTERWVPDDIETLWVLLRSLPADKRDQFVKAGNAYLIAKTMWPEQRTAYASFLVVACEALKPPARRYRWMNVYDVVESLAGEGRGAALRALSVAPQKVRSEHFHRGDLLAGELDELLIADPFRDPSFGSMLDLLATDTWLCLIEWLRKEGEYKVAALPRAHEPLGWFARLRKIINCIVPARR